MVHDAWPTPKIPAHSRGAYKKRGQNVHILATATRLESTLAIQQSIGARLLHAQFQFFLSPYPVAQHAHPQGWGAQVASRTQDDAVTYAEPRQVQAGSEVVGGVASRGLCTRETGWWQRLPAPNSDCAVIVNGTKYAPLTETETYDGASGRETSHSNPDHHKLARRCNFSFGEGGN